MSYSPAVKLRRATFSDWAELGFWAIVGGMATLVPRSLEGWMSRLAHLLYLRYRPWEPVFAAERMGIVIPEKKAQSLRLGGAFSEVSAADFWGRFRGTGLVDWRPSIEILGWYQVEAAIERGRGAMICCSRTGSSTVIKQAFARQGQPLVHLSVEPQGASRADTWGAATAIAPVYARSENRHLAECVKIPLSGSLE